MYFIGSKISILVELIGKYLFKRKRLSFSELLFYLSLGLFTDKVLDLFISYSFKAIVEGMLLKIALAI
jgi:hypothetical protein